MTSFLDDSFGQAFHTQTTLRATKATKTAEGAAKVPLLPSFNEWQFFA